MRSFQLKTILVVISIFLFQSCGTFDPKYANEERIFEPTVPVDEIDQRFYLIGDAGGAKDESTSEALTAFRSFTATKNTENDYVIYLGDNIYPAGLPKKGEDGRENAEKMLKKQLEAISEFKGKKLFIPGNHDWYSDGLKGLKRQEEYIEEALGDSDAFQPEKGCPIEKIEISDNIELLVLDSQWYISDWDKHPTINDECDIKSREAFFLEIEGELKKNNEKTILITMHHPAFTYGLHGGYYNFEKHIFASGNKIPVPGLASLVTVLRSQGGVSPQDRYNNRYNELMKRLITLAADSDRVIFASGHEHTLQYIENQNIKQIVSGSGAKEAPVSLGKGAEFVYGGRGFAVLDVYKNGSSVVSFYSAINGQAELIFSTEVHDTPKDYDTSGLPTQFDATIEASAYPVEETQKSKRYKWFWGDHYRYVYGKNIKVPVLTLDKLNGGMVVERKGGGHQTRSLRLNNLNGKNFALRAVRKSAVQFLQSVAFTDTYIQDDFRETLTEDVIRDFYTSSHPYGAFVVGGLSDAIGLYHTNPQLLYMPKHRALGKYNDEFGGELYIMEERPDDGFLDVASFGNPDGIESTSDLLENLRKDEKYQIDESSYIKARLFDMLLGDWDRHQDQWRWSRFDISDDKSVYKPIPRDRDQVFSNYDGALLSILNTIMPSTKQFQVYDDELKNIKWINLAGIKLDRTLTQTSGLDVWVEQAKYIQENLTDEKIDLAFANLPPEVQDETSNSIKEKLKGRRDYLISIAERYFKHINNLVIITATDKDDFIEIVRERDRTTVSISRIKDGEIKAPFKTRIVNHNETDEIWVYALDDKDQISVKGKGKNPPMLRVVGGQENDTYDVSVSRKIKVYDHGSKPNKVVNGRANIFKFKDNYRYNVYRFNKYIDKVSTILPAVGFNPDDGMQIGLKYSSSKKGFKNDPFQVKHSFGGGYYFATEGFDLSYEGEFSTFFDTWNVMVGGRFTSENFTQNFFGFGNETENNDDELGLDFNRVKTSERSVKFGTVKDGHYGSRIEFVVGAESFEIQETQDRFIADVFSPSFFDDLQIFGAFDFNYSYSGYDNKANPTRGMFFNLQSGVKTNLEEAKRTYGFIKPSLEFYNALSKNRRLVLNTKVSGHFNIGDDFEFYQAATLGATNGLRGFREQRFSGESALAFKADLRYHLAKFKTGLLPLKLGLYGGYDFGRVWLDGEDSNVWHDSYGGGFLINAVDSISGTFGLFNSDDGIRFSFGFGFSL